MNFSNQNLLLSARWVATGMLFGASVGLSSIPGAANPLSLLLPWAAFFGGFGLREARGPVFDEPKREFWLLIACNILAVVLLIHGDTLLSIFSPLHEAHHASQIGAWGLFGFSSAVCFPRASLSPAGQSALAVFGGILGAFYPTIGMGCFLIVSAIAAKKTSAEAPQINPQPMAWLCAAGFVIAAWIATGLWIQSRPLLDPTAGGLVVAGATFAVAGLFTPLPRLTPAVRGIATGALILGSLTVFGLLPSIQAKLLHPDSHIAGRLALLSSALLVGPGLLFRLSHRIPHDSRTTALSLATGITLALFAPWSFFAQALTLLSLTALACVLFARNLLLRSTGVALLVLAGWTSTHSNPGQLLRLPADWDQDALQLGLVTHLKSPQTAARRRASLEARVLIEAESTSSGSFAILKTSTGQHEIELDGVLHQNESRSADTQRMLPHLVAALHPNPLNATVLGDPLGLITEGLIAQEIDRIDVAVPMPEATRALSRVDEQIPNTLLSATVRLIEGQLDAVLRQRGESDLLIEMAHTPWSDAFQGLPGAKDLQQRRNALTSEGLYVLGVDLYWISETTFRQLLHDIHSTFPQAWAFLPPQGADQLVLVGWNTTAPPQWDRFVMAAQNASEDLAAINIRSPLDLADRALCNQAGLRHLGEAHSGLQSTGIHDLGGSRRLLLPLFREVILNQTLFAGNSDLEDVLGPRRKAADAFLSLLESNEQGKMEEVFQTSRQLAQLDSGDRSLDPLIEPYLRNARKALSVARTQGGVTTALERAQTELSAALLLNPKSASAHALMGEVQLIQGRLAAANENFQKALALQPGFRDPLLGLSNIAIKRKDYPSAEKHLREAVTANPKDWLSNYNLGTFLFERGLSDESERVLRRAISLNEGQQSAPNTALAQLYLSRGEATAALMEAHRAIGIEKNALNAYVLGKAYFEVEQPESAAQYFQRAILADPTFWQARAGMGLVFIESAKWNRCIESFERVLELNPEQEAAIQNLAHCEAQLGTP